MKPKYLSALLYKLNKQFLDYQETIVDRAATSKTIIVVVMLLFCIAFLPSCYVTRTLTFLYPDHKDYKRMPSAVITPSDAAERFHFHTSQQATDFGQTLTMRIGVGPVPITTQLDKGTALAFLVIRNDTMLYEHYFDKTTETTPVNTFSIAKGIVDALIGIAIRDGFIPSVETPITDLVPEFKDIPGYEKIQVQHLLDMTSGLDVRWDAGNPFGHLAKTYYGRDLKGFMLKNIRPVHQPGTRFQYNNLNTQLLVFALENVTGRPVTEYLQTELWHPLGMESPAYWMLDRPLADGGTVKAFCCINMVARDYARLGRLYLNNGNWNGKQLVPEAWVQRGFGADTTAGRAWDYHNHWLIMDKERGIYTLRGLYDQDIVIYPKKNIMMVLLNDPQRKETPWFWEYLFNQVINQL